MPHQHCKPKGASLPTLLVYEQDGVFCQYAGAGRNPVCVYDRERSVLEAARRVASSIGARQIRTIFVIEASTTPPPLPPMRTP
jgi:hypothetical protein